MLTCFNQREVTQHTLCQQSRKSRICLGEWHDSRVAQVLSSGWRRKWLISNPTGAKPTYGALAVSSSHLGKT